MRKIRVYLILFLLCSICACCIMAACSDNNRTNYTAQYELEQCSLNLDEFNNGDNTVSYDKKYVIGESTLYFDTNLKDNRTIDCWIDRILKFKQIQIQNELGCVNNVYISNKLINNFKNENDSISVSFKPETTEEEAFAWILQAASGNDDLPYGVFAGLAAHWLQIAKYSNFAYSSIENAGYLTELQFPIYESDNLSENDRVYAWSFSNFLVKELIQIGKTEKQIVAMDIDDLNLFLNNKYKISLPDYSFAPYSTKYHYIVFQDNFTYYISKNFVDCILPIEQFTTSYNHLADWLKVNSETTKITNEVFVANSIYPINVYLYEGITDPNGLSAIGKDFMIVYSAGSFSSEYIYHVLMYKGKIGNARDTLTEFHANTDKYANLMWYYYYAGKASHHTYNSDSLNEKQTYDDAMGLYNKISVVPASHDKFNYWLFADCYSALYTIRHTRFIHRLQSDSLYNYIAREYGEDYVWELNIDGMHPIGEKSIEEVIDEWINYLQMFNN